MNQYRIENAASAEPELYLYGQIGKDFFGEGISADQVVKDLNALGKKKQITVRIDSPGGAVFEGTNIYNALVRNPAKIHIEIDALAASIASIIAMAGDRIRIADNAMMMIHEPAGVVMGTAKDMRDLANLLDKTRGNLIGIYAKRTGLDNEKVSSLMQAESWFNATEALQAGFVTDILPAKTANNAASFDKTLLAKLGYRNIPAYLISNREKPKLEAYRAKHGRMFRLATDSVSV
ncbi:MAG TPA: Clp protease ClpP [Candidatus Competibacteraceae bacterium]|nr:Clp protease ClpP [Candidatus Competibacteraceae bacterium]